MRSTSCAQQQDSWGKSRGCLQYRNTVAISSSGKICWKISGQNVNGTVLGRTRCESLISRAGQFTASLKDRAQMRLNKTAEGETSHCLRVHAQTCQKKAADDLIWRKNCSDCYNRTQFGAQLRKRSVRLYYSRQERNKLASRKRSSLISALRKCILRTKIKRDSRGCKESL